MRLTCDLTVSSEIWRVGRVDQRFVDINGMAIDAAIGGSILVEP
jgi:hypothetical protein